MLRYSKPPFGALVAFTAVLAIITSVLTPLASATTFGRCHAGKNCKSNALGDINVDGSPGEVDIFQVNCPAYCAELGAPGHPNIKLCHKINGNECSGCVQVKAQQCYPVSPRSQWVGLCFDSA